MTSALSSTLGLELGTPVEGATTVTGPVVLVFPTSEGLWLRLMAS